MVSLGAWGRPGLLGRTRQISTVSSGERAGSGGIERTWSSKRPAGKSRCCHALPLRRRSPTGRHDNPARWLQLRGCGGMPKVFAFQPAPTGASRHPDVVSVNQTLARRVFGNKNPIGRRIRLRGPSRSLAHSGVKLDFRGNRPHQLCNTRSSPRKCFFKLRERQSVHDIAGFEPTAPGHRDPVLHILQMADLVGIR